MASVKPAVLRIVGISCSLFNYNRGLIRSAIEICNESIKGVAVEHVDVNTDLEVEHVDSTPLPLLNTDLEVDGKFPAPVEQFRQKIASADAFLFAIPEYNFPIGGIYAEFMSDVVCLIDSSFRHFVEQMGCVNQTQCAYTSNRKI